MQPSLITLNDAITDSPVYRASVQHYDEQLELLDKWLDGLSKQLKGYCERLNKFNLETNVLCKKAMPIGIDNALIDPHFTGAVMKSFSDALQTSLAFKTKLVSDLEDNFIQPLQQFVKTQLKDFKEFRKHHERALERYEAQLNKYATQSKTKEVSALREEAFRLHEARKYYIHMSGQHVVRMLHFRSDLEHTLVDLFSGATMAHFKDFDGGMHVWQKLDHQLASWKQWIVDDKDTCNYQLHKLQTMRRELENEFINQSQPPRDLDKYAPPTLGLLPQSPMHHRLPLELSQEWTPDQNTKPYHKWGYLFTRNARGYWTRRWFFLYDGYFGSCIVHASPIKLKGTISLDERVSVLLSEIKPVSDIDRRYCFEVVSVQQATIILQAETEDEMKDWISAFDKAKQLAIQYQQLPPPPVSSTNQQLKTEQSTDSPTLSKSISTTTTKHDPVTRETTTTTTTNNTTTTSSTNPSIPTITTTAPSIPETPAKHEHSIVVLSTSADNDRVSLANSTSLTPLLVWEAARAPALLAAQPAKSASSTTLDRPANGSGYSIDQHEYLAPPQFPPSNNATNASSSSWGIPWTLVPSMFHPGHGNDTVSPPPSTPATTLPASPHFSSFSEVDQIIWPSQPEDTNVPKVLLKEYTPELDKHNKELRRVFGGVATHEVVVDAFICCLKRPPNMARKDGLGDDPDDDMDWPTTPVGSGSPLEQLEQELQSELSQNVRPPTSQFGYSYTGRAFVTQETFWLYSCVVMSCVHTVAVRLQDIQSIRLIRDPSIINTGKQSNIALAIDFCPVTQGNDVSPRDPLILMSLMDDVEMVAEKLRIAVDNAKSKEPAPLQTIYDILHNMSVAMSKHKNKANVTTIIKTESVTKTQSSPDVVQRRPRSSSTGELPSTSEPSSSPVPTSSKLDRIIRSRRKESNGNKDKPKQQGAVATAMMAATQAGASNVVDVSKSANGVDSSPASSRHKPTATQAANSDQLPPHITPPKGPLKCDCSDHLEKMEYEADVLLPAKTLFDLLFSEEKTGQGAHGGIWQDKTAASGSRDLHVGAWADVEGKSTRYLKYVMPVNNPMVKAKEADVVETQVLLKKDPYLRYVVQISTKSAQLPYADAFIPSIRYCISWAGPNQCHISVCLGVKFVKNILVKGMVMKAAMKGMGESITQFMPIVMDSVQSINGTSGKTNRLSTGQHNKGEIAKSLAQANGAMPQKDTSQDSQGWLGTALSAWDTLQDLVSHLPWTVAALVGGVLSLWILWIAISPSTPHHSAKTPLSKSVISRAVYLRDVEDGLLQANTTSIYDIEHPSFQIFLHERTVNPNVTSTLDQWYSRKHHSISVELLYSRERIAILRHDTLMIFNLLNQVDAQLLENEYVNWLLDARLECYAGVTVDNAVKCETVHHQLQAITSSAI
ncbi:hypothetical protein DM01DRAFT_1311533, partial [Hesseltinella vesiculosa]